jgi:F-type H+-transporting ATPase subunit c
VVRWRTADGAARFCAVHGGVFTVSAGRKVAIACREGVVGDSLEVYRRDRAVSGRSFRADPVHGPRCDDRSHTGVHFHSACNIMDHTIQMISIFAAAMAVSFGAIGPALGEGRAVAAAMDAIARQPDSAGIVSRTLFVGLAMIETMAIYALVVALLVLFANPFVK